MERDDDGRPLSKWARCQTCGKRERILADEHWECPACNSPEALTCYECKDREDCEYVDDPWNTDGDCLRDK